MAISRAQQDAINRYTKKTYDSIQFRVPKGKRELYNNYAAQRGLSLAAYISGLIEADNAEDQE